MKQDKLKRVLSRLSSFDDQISGTFKDLDGEIAKVSKSLKESITAKTIDQVGEEFKRFERKLKPLFDAIQSLKTDLLKRERELESKIEATVSDFNRALSENRDFSRAQADSFLTEVSSLNEELKGVKKALSTDIEDVYGSVSDLSVKLNQTIKDFKKELADTNSKIGEKLSKKVITDEFNNLLETFRQEINVRLSAHLGGGNMNRQVKVNGTDVLTRYTDFNLVGSLTTANDDTNKRVNITIGGGGGFTALTATGTIDDSNVTFTFASAPTYVVINGIWRKSGEGWSGTTTVTLTAPVGVGGSIWGVA